MFLFRKRPASPTIPVGRRVYAVGDIHGERALYDRLIAMIQADDAGRAPAETMIILLGDLIDRGPESSGVIERAMQPPGWAQLRALKGNHEAALLDALDGDRDMLRLWLRHGGVPAARSWGIPQALLDDGSADEVIEALRQAIPAAQRGWMARMLRCLQIGDYFFVHAGVRPGVKLSDQSEADFLWIRDDFLQSRRDHGAMIVHGHSVSAEIEQHPNRIGLDTGAYDSGRLSAVGLEGRERWFLQTG